MNDSEFEERLRQLHLLEQERLRIHGWIGRFVFETEEPPPGEHVLFNAYTVGIEESFGHLNFQIVLPLHQQIINGIFHTLVDRLKEGVRFEDEMLSDKVLEGFDVEFMKTKTSRGEFLRVLIPDPKGLLPNDPLCDPPFKAQLNALRPAME